MTSVIVELDRKISQKIERGKGMQLTPEQLDILVAVGAIDRLKEAAAEELRRAARERSEQRQLREAPSAPRPRHHAESAREGQERALRILGRDHRGLDRLLAEEETVD